MCVQTNGKHAEVRGQLAQTQFSPSPTWILGTELRLSAFICWANAPAQDTL